MGKEGGGGTCSRALTAVFLPSFLQLGRGRGKFTIEHSLYKAKKEKLKGQGSAGEETVKAQ